MKTMLTFVIWSLVTAFTYGLLDPHTNVPTIQQATDHPASQMSEILAQMSVLNMKLQDRIHALEVTVTAMQKKIDSMEKNEDLKLTNLSHLFTQSTHKLEQRVSSLESTVSNLATKEPNIVFLATLTHDESAHTGPLVFDSLKVNLGNAYSTQTGMFTAPVDGIYSFSVTLATNDVADTHGYITHNGNRVGYIFADKEGTGKYPKGSTSVAIYCARGDHVWFDWLDSGVQVIKPWKYTYFSGYLVHMDQ